MKYSVLITGCSTGIGRALAEEFHKQGHVVFATARRIETIADMAKKGINVCPLDVTDEISIQNLKVYLSNKQVRLNVLVNNAGYGGMGPLAEFPLNELRRQFETNVFSVVAITQALLPNMMGVKGARIINISSISAAVTTPFSGAYCASKAALNSISDALRMELSPFRIKVITVEPGGIRSEFGNTAEKLTMECIRSKSMYESMKNAVIARAKISQEKTISAEAFAIKLIQKALSDNPEITIRIGPNSRFLPFLKRFFSTATLDRLFCKKFGVTIET